MTVVRVGWVRVAAAALCVATVLGACSGGSDGGSDGGDALSAASDAEVAQDAGGGSARAASSGQEVAATRAVVRTAEVSLVAEDVDGARAGIGRLLDRWGGYVADEETDHDRDGDARSSYLRLRVPAARLDRVLAELAGLGAVRSTLRQERDVSAEVIDVDARIRTTRASLLRLRAFLARAEDVDALVRLESEIAERESSLDSLTGRRDHLAGQVELARVTVYVTRPDAPEPAALEGAGFVAGLRGGWDALVGVAVVAATAAGAAVPFAVALLVLGAPVVLWLRARRREPAGPHEPGPEPT